MSSEKIRTMEATSLPEFLLARFAEDEDAWSGGLDLATRPDFAKLSRHMLAECEAKRKIVEEHRADHGSDPCDAHNASFETVPCDTLRFLAAIYADHPSYREEWKP